MKRSMVWQRVLAVTLALALCIGLVPLSGLLSLETAAVNIVKPIGENMFLQGHFEGVDLRDWSTNVSGVSVLNQLSADAEHSDGTRGLQLVTGTNEGGVRATVYGLTSGATYQLALWAKAGTSAASTLRVGLHQWTDSWGSDVKSVTAISTSVTSEWVQYTYEFTMDVNRTIIQFDVQTGAGTLWVDDVTVIRTADVPTSYLKPASTDVYNLTADLGAAPHTYEGWIEVDGTQAGAIIGNYSTDTSAANNNAASYGVQYRNKKLEFWLWGGSGKAPQIRVPFTALTLPTNEKFHFAIVSDPVADTVTCYINGGTANGGSQQTVDTDEYIAGEYYSWDTWYNGETPKYATLGIAYDYVGASRLLRVGGNSTATSLAGTKLYSLAMYSDARSQEDVVLDMTRVPYESTSLMAAYDFTAVGNERLEDHSTNNNHLTYSDGTNTENYDTTGMSFEQNVVWYSDATMTEVPVKWTASVNLPADLNDYERGGIIIGNVGNRGSSNNSSFSFEVLAQGKPRIFWNSKVNGKTTLVFDQFDLRTGEWIDLTATIDTTASTVTLTDGTTTQTLSYTNALPPILPYTTSDANGEFEMDPGWMPLTVGGDSIDGNTKYFRGKIKAVAAYDSADAEVLSYALTDTDADGLTAAPLWIRDFEEPTDYDYAMMTVGDTQIVNWYYPDDFDNIYDYIVKRVNATGDKIKMVMGLGDITEMGTVESEWKLAYEQISKLNGVVDYSVIRGNHDGVLMHSYFPYEDFKDKLTGSYDGTLLNTWRTFTAGDVDYLLLTLDYFPKAEVLEWASDIVGAHPNHTVIVNTHAFLDYKGDLLSTRTINPFTTGAGGTIEQIWDILISQHENIQLVLCGHISSQGLVQTTLARDGMSDVNCMLLDPQGMDASIGATSIVDTLYFSDVKADGTVDIELVSYSTTRKEYYGESFVSSIKPVAKVTPTTDAGSITLSGAATVGGTTKIKEITVPYTGTTTAAIGTRFAGQIVDGSDSSVMNTEMVLNDGTVTFTVPVTVYPEKMSVAAGTVFTSFDNTTTLTIGADYNDTLYTVAELNPTNFQIWNNNVMDQPANKRTCIYFWSEDLNYDPGTGKWEDMIPNSGLTVYLDGKKCTAMIIGETPNTESTTGNAVAIIYLYESQSGITGVAENCSTIVIPAGTEVLTPDSRSGIRFTADTGMKKVGGVWTVYDPSVVEIEPYEVTVGFDAAQVNDNGTVYLPVTTSDGKALMDTYGDWTTAFGTIYVDDAEWANTAYSITGSSFYMGGLGMNNISKIEIKAGTVLAPDSSCNSSTPIMITNDLVLVKTDGVWAQQGGDPAEETIEIDFENAAHTVAVNYNTDHTRTWLQVTVGDATLPGSKYAGYSGTATIDVDGESYTGHFQKLTTDTQFQIYMAGNGINHGETASRITIPAGTTCTYADTENNVNYTITFTNDFTIAKQDGVWVKYKPEVLPSDHTATVGPNLPEGKTNLIANPSFTGNNTSGYSISATASGVDNMLEIQSGYVQSPEITLTAGKTYRLSYYVWVESSTATADIEIYMSGKAGATGGWLDFAIKNGTNTSGNVLTGVTDAWVEQWIEWTAPADGTVYFGFKDYGETNFGTNDSTYYIDDICLYDVNEVVPTYETIEIDFENAAHTVGVNYNSGASRTWLQVTVGDATLPGANYTVYSGTASVDVDGTTYTGGFQKLTTDNQFQIYMAGNGINHGETASKITIPAGTSCTYTDTANNIHYTITFTNDFIIVKENGAWVKYKEPVVATRESISIKSFSWAHGGIVGVNMGNYDTLSACDWWSDYSSSGPYFYANGNVYLDGSDTPTSVRIALPTGTNNNIFIYGMPADGVDDVIDIRIKQGEEFLSEQGEVILVFDKDYTIHKTAMDAGHVTEATTSFTAYNVTLSSDMKVGVQITPVDGVALSDLTLSYTLAGGEAQFATFDSTTGLFYCNVPAKDMTSELVLSLTAAGTNVQPSNTATTNLRAYALKLLTGEQTDAVKAAAKAMLNYGAMAQTYFAHNTGSLANVDYAYTAEELAAANPGTVTGVHANVSTKPAAYAGASLLLKSETGIRLYFSENVDGALTYSDSRQMYYYEFADIGAADLDATQTVTLGGVTYEVSVLSMAKQVIDGNYKDSFKDLMKAITLYNDAAEALQ